MAWGSRESLRRRREFIAQRGEDHPMLVATTLIFTVTWLCGWGVSFLLLHAGMASMPLRYALGFLASYGVFFMGVRRWCKSVRDRRSVLGDLNPGVADPSARSLFANTLRPALVMLVVLVVTAAALQRAAPGAKTFSDAVTTIRAGR